LINWAHHGPALARVEAVQVADAAWDGASVLGFVQRETL